jgi:protein TonB
MRRESVISVGLALASHAAVLFCVPAILLRPALKSPEPAYIEVTLAAAPPVMPVAEPEPQVSQPAPRPTPKPDAEPPPPTEPAFQQPDPLVAPLKPEILKLPVPPPAEPPPAPPESAQQVATASTPDLATASPATQVTQATGINAVTKQASVSSEYQLLSQPYYVKRGQAKYPLEAKKLRQEGTVVLALYINALGRLDKIEIKESSGFPLLDEAAIAAERQSRFRPAYIGNRPAPSKAEVPYRFQLAHD